jgi:hypothetical protein
MDESRPPASELDEYRDDLRVIFLSTPFAESCIRKAVVARGFTEGAVGLADAKAEDEATGTALERRHGLSVFSLRNHEQARSRNAAIGPEIRLGAALWPGRVGWNAARLRYGVVWVPVRRALGTYRVADRKRKVRGTKAWFKRG